MERLTGRFKDGGAFILPSVVSQLSPMKSEVIEKLADYEDAEEQGLLLRLPCKVGDKFYYICNLYNVAKKKQEKQVVEETFISLDVIADYTRHIGKTVFLTREEAEKALADMGVEL